MNAAEKKNSGSFPITARPRSRKPVLKASSKKTTIAAVGGSCLGLFVPVAAHTLSNAPEYGQNPSVLWLMVGCLTYSAPTVCAWAGRVLTLEAQTGWAKFLGWAKAFGFVLCLEGILVAAPQSCAWLSWVALALLMGINSIILANTVRRSLQ